MILGIDIGGTNTDIVAYDGEFRHVVTLKTAELSADKLEKVVAEAEAVGIGIAAWIRSGKIVKAPNLQDFEMPKISKRYVVENDANCFAFFAAKIFAAKNLFGVTVGTGIGSGIVIDGKIYRGSGLAGEIGHTFATGKRVCSCGGVGHLEAYFGGRFMDARALLESGRIYRTLGFRLFCRSIASVVMLLDPDVVAIGGRIGGRLDARKVEEEIKKHVAEEFEFEVKTVRDDLAVAKGAALIAEASF